MTTSSPCVSIGLPVYNGERFLKAALDSILGQSYGDFELIISDNASTDGTEQICRSYMARDQRIRYHRNETNIGAARNFNQVYRLSTGKYFKWAAYDDTCAPDFLARCVEVLERDPEVVLCFSKTIQIDEQGCHEEKRDYDLPNLGSPIAHERFHDIILKPHSCEAVFGLIRSDKLKRTRLIGNYIGSDRVLLALLSVHGRFLELPDYLFFQREHPGRSVKGKDYEVTAWFDPTKGKKIVFPLWRIMWEYALITVRTSMNAGDRLRCFRQVIKWIGFHRQGLKWDLSFGVDRVMLLRGYRAVYRPLRKWVLSDRFPLSKWVATSIALIYMGVVEGISMIFRAVGSWAHRKDRSSA